MRLYTIVFAHYERVKGDIFRYVSKCMACPYSLNSIMDLQRNYRQLLGLDMSRASEKRKVR